MYGIITYIYHTNQPNVGTYTIHGSYGLLNHHLGVPNRRELGRDEIGPDFAIQKNSHPREPST